MHKVITSTGALVAGAAMLVLAGCGGGGGDVGSNGKDETPIINKQPYDTTVTTGAVATFSVGADGNRLHYTWLRDGQPIVGGPDRPQYSITASYKDDNHLFSVLVINDAGQVKSQGGLLTLALTPDEKLAEAELLNGGYYSLNWRLSTGATQTSGEDYFFGQKTVLPESPLAVGAVTTVESFTNLSTLPFSTINETPVIVADNYDFVLNDGPGTISYTASGIDDVDYDSSGTLPSRSYTRTQYVFTPLTGPISSTPTELKELMNVVFSNPAVLDQTVNWQAGAGYLTFREVADQDQFVFQDCNGQPTTATPTTTTNTLVSACPGTAGATIVDTMTKGVPDPVNQVTHVLADGAVYTIQDTSVWVATAPNPQTYPGQTVTYLAYAQTVSGIVFQGYVVRAGTVISGDDLEMTGPNTYAYPAIHFRVNPAAFATLQTASRI